MSRFSRYDTDEERLPEGMTRVGYDADTQVYTFQDADGSYWESAPGSQYGRLTRVGSGPADHGDDDSDSEPFLAGQAAQPKVSWRHDMMPLLNFGVLVGLSLLVLFWFIGRKPAEEKLEVVTCEHSVTIQENDNCWDIAQAAGMSVDDILGMNTGLDCGKLTDTSSIKYAENLTVHGRLAYANIAVDEIGNSSGVPGASIGVIYNGDVIHIYNFGYRDVGNQLRTTSNTVYGIGSVTESFIVAGIARLVEDKRLTWDTPVLDVLPESEQQDANIAETLTVADILSHRSGLAGSGDMNLAFQGGDDTLLQKESLFSFVRQFKQLFPMRTNWSYFVWGYALAGAIIEKVTNQSIDTFMSETIFEPLSLENTTFDPNSVDAAKFAEPYAGLEDGTPFHLRKRQVLAGTFFEASGGIYSSLDDMLKWSKAMLDAAQATPG
ncbi:hypothetical protein MKX08_000156 [Trichoderma sp. CBMAI-0020]|nr:hypothetical protein MKX08_000156 [Trichoderma sp. CBMAI-0020]